MEGLEWQIGNGLFFNIIDYFFKIRLLHLLNYLQGQRRQPIEIRGVKNQANLKKLFRGKKNFNSLERKKICS
ncbi:MAG: hypothetical protein ACJAW3_000886 [Lentimonas sp.]